MTDKQSVMQKQGFFMLRSRLRGRLDAEYNFALLTIHIPSKYGQRVLREMSYSRSGGTPNKAKMEYWDGEIPWASPKDFVSFYLEETIDHITEAAITDSSTIIIPTDTLLMVVRSGVLQHTLPIAITKKPMAINQDVKAIIFDKSILPEYAGVYFSVFGKRLLPLITKSGATVQSINTEQFGLLSIPVPPIKIQQECIRLFRTAYKVKEELETKANETFSSIDSLLLRELGITPKPTSQNTLENRIFKCAFSEVTGGRLDPLYHHGDIFAFVRAANCDVTRLGNHVAIFLTGFAAGRNDQGEEEDGIIQFRPTNINEDRELVFRRNIYIASDELKKRPLDRLNRKELLFNNTNSQEQVGKTVYFDLEGDYFCSNHITRIATDGDRLDPQYLFYVLNLYQRQKVFYKLCTNWNNQSGVGVDVLSKIPVPLPGPERQKQIVLRLNKIRTDAQEFRRKAALELDEAKKAIEAMILGEGGK